jgi:hypothetical protein
MKIAPGLPLAEIDLRLFRLLNGKPAQNKAYLVAS